MRKCLLLDVFMLGADIDWCEATSVYLRFCYTSIAQKVQNGTCVQSVIGPDFGILVEKLNIKVLNWV